MTAHAPGAVDKGCPHRVWTRPAVHYGSDATPGVAELHIRMCQRCCLFRVKAEPTLFRSGYASTVVFDTDDHGNLFVLASAALLESSRENATLLAEGNRSFALHAAAVAAFDAL